MALRPALILKKTYCIGYSIHRIGSYFIVLYLPGRILMIKIVLERTMLTCFIYAHSFVFGVEPHHVDSETHLRMLYACLRRSFSVMMVEALFLVQRCVSDSTEE